jgi:hypothetical protein
LNKKTVIASNFFIMEEHILDTSAGKQPS